MKYFDGQISKNLIYLYFSRVIAYFSNGFFSIFLPIFIYKTFNNNIHPVLLFYFFASFTCIIIYPLTAKYIEKYNLKKSLLIGVVAVILFLIALGLTNTENAQVMLIISLILLIISRLFYWLPYHVSFTSFSDQNNRMREVSTFQATLHMTGIISPLIAGFIIENLSYQALFFIGVSIYSTSIIPLLFMSGVYENFSWNYSQTWKKLFAKKYRHAMVAHFADGVETAVGMVIWPIFIYTLLNGDYVSIGLISTLAILITVLLELIVGKKADLTIRKKKVLKIGSVLYAFGWLIKIFIITGFQIFLADMYHKITQSLSKNSLSAITYDISADEGHYVDEFTVIKEMALHAGRSTLYFSSIILVTFIDIKWVFAIAAISAVLVNSIRLQTKIN